MPMKIGSDFIPLDDGSGYRSPVCGTGIIDPNSLTFYKVYSYNRAGINASFAKGSKLATFTATRGASNPATYLDANGVIQKTTTSNEPRLCGGYYSSNGFGSYSGVLIEQAATNYLLNSYFSLDSNSDGLAGSFTSSWGTTTLTAATDISGITSHKWQRVQYT